MTTQFDRVWEVQIGTAIVSTLDVRFKITRTLRSKPNTAEVTIYNLNERTRGEIAEAPKNATIQIKAGYRGRPAPSAALAAVDAAIGSGGAEPDPAGVIYLGDVRLARSEYLPPDWETYVESGDGERSARTARTNRSFRAGTSVQTVFKQIAKDLQVSLGNAAKRAIESGSLEEAGQEFLNGVTVSGNAHRELAALAASAGLEFSVQNGEIQLLERGKPLQDVSVVLSPDTGLIGSPSIGDKGIVNIRALLNPDIVPGRQIEVESRSISGRMRVERCDYSGDTRGNDWYVDMEAKEL